MVLVLKIRLFLLLEVSLNRLVKFVCNEDDTACVTTVNSERILHSAEMPKATQRIKFGFFHEAYYPDHTLGTLQ